jgi:hypothetical protein
MTGRHFIPIDNYIVTRLRERGVSWNDIASHAQVNVARETLRLWRIRTNFVEPRINLSDDDLDAVISNHIDGETQRGQVTIESFLSLSGYAISRARIRESMHRVDPEGVAARSRKTIQRRVYSVIGPHHLWHHDGNHKLIRYGIVIHGCIDGRTRTVIYVAARDNNTALTVLHLFEDGVRRFQLPSRARGDRGGENRRVCEFMIEHRGIGRNSYITGTSTHNNRIERLWKDVRQHTTNSYITLFHSLEEDGLDINNPLQLFTLQYLFLPRINQSLMMFADIWNNHKLRTEHSRTPLQLIGDLSDTIASPEDIDPEEYGIDGEEEEDNIADDNNDSDQVQCDPLECPLNGEQLIEFKERVPVLTLANSSYRDLPSLFYQALHVMNEIYGREVVGVVAVV